MSEFPMPCIVCGFVPDPVFSAQPTRQPADAVMFYAYGQYGSTVFDPQDGSQLQITVCDSCLAERRDRVWHFKYHQELALMEFSEPWNPEREPHT